MKQAEDNRTRDLVNEADQKRHALKTHLENIERSIDNGLCSIETLENEKAEIERLGFTHASLHWRDGKYLYLIHPSHDGQRVREYIGADPETIEAAKARVARAARHRQIGLELDELNRRLRNIERYLQTAQVLAPGFDPW